MGLFVPCFYKNSAISSYFNRKVGHRNSPVIAYLQLVICSLSDIVPFLCDLSALSPSLKGNLQKDGMGVITCNILNRGVASVCEEGSICVSSFILFH